LKIGRFAFKRQARDLLNLPREQVKEESYIALD